MLCVALATFLFSLSVAMTALTCLTEVTLAKWPWKTLRRSSMQSPVKISGQFAAGPRGGGRDPKAGLDADDDDASLP